MSSSDEDLDVAGPGKDFLDELEDDSGSHVDGSAFRDEVAKVDATKASATAAVREAFPKPTTLISRGTRVSIINLQSRADLNGKSGRVVMYVEEKGRYKVQIDEDGSSIAVKPDNIAILPKNPTFEGTQKPRGCRSDDSALALPEHMVKEFGDQQTKLTNAAIQLGNLEEKIAKHKREARRVELTMSVVDHAKEDLTMYAQFGRCFIQQDKTTMVKNLGKATDNHQVILKKLQDSHAYYQRQREETTRNLNEMLESLRQNQGV